MWEATFRKGYRLIASADHTPGYQDTIIIEERDFDRLGGERWNQLFAFRPATKADDTILVPRKAFVALVDELQNVARQLVEMRGIASTHVLAEVLEAKPWEKP
ncbi:MAG: hypothetical protein ACTHU0_01135 [Kofleriaceae bacterium]